ncbi:transposase, partial [mine drainage metagenome]
ELPTPAALHEAFLWAEKRTVGKTGTVSLFGNVYEVDPALVSQRVELVFDPFRLDHIEIRYEGRAMGEATAHVIGRHSHPRVAAAPEPPIEPTGIEYLRIVERRHAARTARQIAYSDLEGGEVADLDVPTDGPGPCDIDTDTLTDDTKDRR